MQVLAGSDTLQRKRQNLLSVYADVFLTTLSLWRVKVRGRIWVNAGSAPG